MTSEQGKMRKVLDLKYQESEYVQHLVSVGCDEDDDIIAVKAAAGVDAELVDDFEVVLAPVLDIHEGEVQRGAVVTFEATACAESLRDLIDVW